MLAVGLFFALIGGGSLTWGIVGLFIQILGGSGRTAVSPKWFYLMGGGFISLILGFLMAMTYQ